MNINCLIYIYKFDVGGTKCFFTHGRLNFCNYLKSNKLIHIILNNNRPSINQSID